MKWDIWTKKNWRTLSASLDHSPILKNICLPWSMNNLLWLFLHGTRCHRICIIHHSLCTCLFLFDFFVYNFFIWTLFTFLLLSSFVYSDSIWGYCCRIRLIRNPSILFVLVCLPLLQLLYIDIVHFSAPQFFCLFNSIWGVYYYFIYFFSALS